MLTRGSSTVREPRRTVTWPDLLGAASTPEDVIGVARDYLATWGPEELERLPSECKPPGRFFEPEEVVSYAFSLVQHHCGPAASNAELARLVNFFSDAARRIAVVMSETPAPASENDAKA